MRPLPRPLALGILAASLAIASSTASSLAASSPSEPPSIEAANVDHAQVLAPHRVEISGEITCSKGAHFHANALVLEPATGALGKGKTPPKLPKRSAAYARYKALTQCTGAAQSWSLAAVSSGKPPLPFAPGQVKACVTFDVTKHHRFSDLKDVCALVNT